MVLAILASSAMAVSPTHPRPRAVLKALIEEARRRARKRRLIYAGAATTLLLTSAVVLALPGDSGRISDHAQPSPATSAPAHLALQRAPYIGVSCRTPNSIACDRVGLAIWLRRPGARLPPTINSAPSAMGLPCGSARHRETCSSYCRHVAARSASGWRPEG